MAGRNVDIRFDTTADTKGAKESAEAIKENEKAVEATTEATKELTAAEAEREKRREEAQARSRASSVDSAANEGGEQSGPVADVAPGSALDEALRKLDESAAKAGAELAEVEDILAGVGVEGDATAPKIDKVVQSVKALATGSGGLQTGLKGVVGALGGPLGIALAAAAAIPAIIKLVEHFSGAEQKAKDAAEQTKLLAEAIKQTAKNVGEMTTEDIDDYVKAIDVAFKAADKLARKFDETKTAENNAAISRIDNAGKVAEAEMLIANALGQQVDHVKYLEEAEERAAQKRAEVAKQQIDAKREELDAANKTLESLRQQQQLLTGETRKTEVKYQAEMKIVDALRQQKEEMEEIAKRPQPNPFQPGGFEPGAGERIERERKERDDAIASLDPASDFSRDLAVAEEKWAALEAAVGTSDKGLYAKLLAVAEEITKAENVVADKSKAFEVESARIDEDQRVDDSLGRAKVAAERTKQINADLDEVGETITESTQKAINEARKAEEQARQAGEEVPEGIKKTTDILQKLLEDGVEDYKQAPLIHRKLVELREANRGINNEVAKIADEAVKQVGRLITVINGLSIEQRRQNARIEELERQNKGILQQLMFK